MASFIKSREAYERVGGLLSDLGPQEQVILDGIKEYYERDPSVQSVDAELLGEAVARGLPNPKHADTLRKVILGLASTECSPPNVVADFIAVRRKAVGDRLATALAAGKAADAVSQLLAEYQEWLDREDIDEDEGDRPAVVAVAKPVKELVATRLSPSGLIKVAPNSLNERLGGGLLRGHHLIVFARPEVGKTMVLINMACQFAKQGLKVLYCGNEDPVDDLIMRAVSRLSDRTRAAIMEAPEEAEQAAIQAGYDKIVFAELAPGTPEDIEALVEEHRPDVVIIDQLRNLNVGEDNFVRALEKAASAVRNMGKRQNVLVVSATQAGDSASGKSVLDMGDVDNSNTGIPAQADVLLGVGMSPDDETRGVRVFSLCKNKPGNNHDYFPVYVEPAKSKVRS